MFPFSLSATTAGSISLIAKADVLNAVDEAYEDNNAAVSAAIPVSPQLGSDELSLISRHVSIFMVGSNR